MNKGITEEPPAEKPSRKGVGGRPRTGLQYPNKFTAYLSDEQLAWLDEWAGRQGWERAQAVRELVDRARSGE